MTWYQPLKVTDLDSAIISSATPHQMTEKLKMIMHGNVQWKPQHIEGEVSTDDMLRLVADLVVARSLFGTGDFPNGQKFWMHEGQSRRGSPKLKLGPLKGVGIFQFQIVS